MINNINDLIKASNNFSIPDGKFVAHRTLLREV
jgi:hypothetical protein